MQNFLILFASLIILMKPSRAVEAQKLPLYEFGFGLMGARFPTYPGSSESISLVLPIPAMAYRGSIFRTVKEGGVKGRIFVSDDFEFDISFDGNFSSSRYESKIRLGMPPLGLLLEMGPRVTYFWNKGSDKRLELCFAVRKAFHAVWPSLRQNGYSASPYLNLRFDDFNQKQGTLLLRFGAKYGSNTLMNYFYEVDHQYATANRPRYEAKPGLLGYFLVANFYQPISSRSKIFISNRFYDYRYAKNRESPLLTEKNNWTIALGLLYTFFKSEEMVQMNRFSSGGS